MLGDFCTFLLVLYRMLIFLDAPRTMMHCSTADNIQCKTERALYCPSLRASEIVAVSLHALSELGQISCAVPSNVIPSNTATCHDTQCCMHGPLSCDRSQWLVSHLFAMHSEAQLSSTGPKVRINHTTFHTPHRLSLFTDSDSLTLVQDGQRCMQVLANGAPV
jgi:hypothetical protein